MRAAAVDDATPEVLTATGTHPGAIEQVLLQLKAGIERTLQPGGQASAPAELHTGAQVAAAPRARAGGDSAAFGHTPSVREPTTQPQTAPRLAGGASLASELAARDGVIAQLQAANAILEQKVVKLEQLLRLRDAKLAAMLTRLGVDPDAK